MTERLYGQISLQTSYDFIQVRQHFGVTGVRDDPSLVLNLDGIHTNSVGKEKEIQVKQSV